jgi:hypothetical protein
MADNEPHSDVEYLLGENEAQSDAVLLHSTSWRVDGPAIVLTYIAVIRCDGLVRDRWANAMPVSSSLTEVVGKPPTNSPIDPPAPRYVDVLMHGLRHLKFLLDTDATNAAALDDTWQRHLAELNPALATMYSERHSA